MATLPNPKSPPTPPIISTDTFFARPASEFDVGINASNAWVAEHGDRDLVQSNSDEEEAADTPVGRAARALYDFEGKLEFQELIVSAGDGLVIIKEDLDEGWSLAKLNGKVGLVPKAYYAVCTQCTPFVMEPDSL